MSEMILFLDSAFYGTTSLLLVVAGILVSIRLFNYPDLTVDGSFTLGACVYCRLTVLGMHQTFCILGAAFSGMLAGLATATLNEKFKIGQILSSVLVMLALVSSAPYILGRATVGLLQHETLLARLEAFDKPLSRALFPELPFVIHPVATFTIVLLGLAVLWVLRVLSSTRIGLMVRYHGSSENPGALLGGNMYRVKLCALGLGNCLIALGGALEAQRRGGADQNMGIGMILIALASLILGETVLRLIFGKRILSLNLEILAVMVGVLIYSLVIQVTVTIGQSVLDIRLVSILFLAFLLAFASRRFPRNLDMF